MKKLLALATAGALCASCLLIAGCGGSEGEPADSNDPASSIVEELNPVGEYQFDSIAIETPDGEITAAGHGAEWNGDILDENYATLVVNEDGSLVSSGALNAAGVWTYDDGIFGVSLNGYDCVGCSIDADGLLSIDIMADEDIMMFYFQRI